MDDDLSQDEALVGPPLELSVPAFQSGGRVERTGIALVHEGEYIMPAPGSEALIGPDGGAGGPVINFYFPLEIEVIGALSEAQLRAVTEYVCEVVNTALRSRL